jgi:hypothetical protein
MVFFCAKTFVELAAYPISMLFYSCRLLVLSRIKHDSAPQNFLSVPKKRALKSG